MTVRGVLIMLEFDDLLVNLSCLRMPL